MGPAPRSTDGHQEPIRQIFPFDDRAFDRPTRICTPKRRVLARAGHLWRRRCGSSFLHGAVESTAEERAETMEGWGTRVVATARNSRGAGATRGPEGPYDLYHPFVQRTRSGRCAHSCPSCSGRAGLVCELRCASWRRAGSAVVSWHLAGKDRESALNTHRSREEKGGEGTVRRRKQPAIGPGEPRLPLVCTISCGYYPSALVKRLGTVPSLYDTESGISRNERGSCT